MKIAISTCLLLCSMTASAGMEDYFENYLSELETKNSLLFLSSCTTANSTLRLLLPLGSNSGLLVESIDSSVINLVIFNINETAIEVVDGHGGVYSLERAFDLVRFLMNSKFVLVNSEEIKSSFLETPQIRCKNEKGVGDN